MTKFLAAAAVLTLLAAAPVQAQTKIQIGCTATSSPPKTAAVRLRLSDQPSHIVAPMSATFNATVVERATRNTDESRV